MSNHSDYKHSKRYLFTILLPTILTLAFLISIIYRVVIPAFEKSFLDGKKTTIQQLTSVVVSIMTHYENSHKQGLLTEAEAQNMAMREIEELRYGDTKQDYFWICDLQPKMVMHPYSKEMIGADLNDYKDSSGKKIFLEFIELVSSKKNGFLYHTWHTKYDDETVVPKLTYVTKFAPWGWIVGTGVFLDDVKKKTDQIYGYLSKLAFGVVLIVSFLFFYLGRQSLINEQKRLLAETELRKSREKYKTLVESATEPMMMFFDRRCIYSNSSMQRLLVASGEELETFTLMDLFPGNQLVSFDDDNFYDNLLNSNCRPDGLETSMSKKDGTSIQVLLNFSAKLLGDEKVLLMTARDMSSRKRIEEELGVSRQRYQWLTNQLHLGIFRTSSDSGFKVLTANSIALNLLDLSEKDLGETQLTDILDTDFDPSFLLEKLLKKSVIKDEVVPIKSINGSTRLVSISMVMTRDTKNNPLYCDGIIEDVSQLQVRDEKREDLIVELQSSVMFLNQPIKNVLPDRVSCNFNTTVHDAAKLMSISLRNAILLTDDSDTVVGIIGDSDLREKIIVENISSQVPVHEVMNTQIDTIEETTPIFEAVLMMGEQNVDHLLVQSKGEITGVISNKELLQVHQYSATFLLKEINQSNTLEEIVNCHTKVPEIVKALIDSGVHAKNITRIITSIADSVFAKIMEFSLHKMGPPPVPFVFLGLGSEGRGEQTLATDQDNAIIFADVEPEDLEAVQSYFSQLGEQICYSLDQVGYVFCKGEVMAMNPRWCKPLGTWKDYFSNWITNSTPQDLMELNIFFDYRSLYGEFSFVDEIRNHVQHLLKNRPVFYHLMAENNLLFKIPLDFFGNISVESDGKHANCFNIKHVLAMVVGYARIHGVKHFLETSNTLERLELLHDNGTLSKEAYNELVDSYDYLMQMRFRHQVQKIDKGEHPDNWLNIDDLTLMEQDMLKKIFSKVATLRKKLTGKGQSDIFF